ncbi:hypothetical protein APHAL10511_007330 [Amanita phalloides]|nr:hypothetical protein APHAL10511_007330 [Amanita phalloides]
MVPEDKIRGTDKIDNSRYGQAADSDDYFLEQVISFPEGGSRAWMTLTGSFIIQFCSFGYMNAFGVYNDFYVRVYLSKNSASQISWIGSIQLFLVLFMGIISGRAFDAGYFYHINTCGSLLFGFSLFMLSLSHPGQYYQVVLAQGLANSIAIGILYVPSIAIVSHYFKRRRAFAMGVAAAGSAVGGAIHPIMLNQLFHGRVGFHNGVRASAGLNLGLLLIAILLMKTRLPPRGREDSLLNSFSRFMREPAYLLATSGTIIVIIGYYFPIFFLQLYAIKRGVNSALAFYSLTILNGTSIFGRIIPNLIVHKYGVMNAILVCSVSCTVMIFCILAVRNAVGIIFFGAVYGFFTGAYASLLGPMLAGLAKKDSEIGARMGICYSLAAFGGLIGNPIAGALLTSSFIWWRPIIFAGVAVALGGICFFAARVFLVKEKGTIFV